MIRLTSLNFGTQSFSFHLYFKIISQFVSGAFQKLYRIKEKSIGMEDDVKEGPSIEAIGEKKRFFSCLDIFKGVEKERLQFLSQMAIKRSFSPAQTIIRQGEEPDAIYFLKKGNVELYRLPVTFISASEKRLNLHEDTAMSASQHLSAVRLFNMM
jgi:hypothetical protein